MLQEMIKEKLDKILKDPNCEERLVALTENLIEADVRREEGADLSLVLLLDYLDDKDEFTDVVKDKIKAMMGNNIYRIVD